MAYELKDGSGTLFRNNKKQEGSKQPDCRGELMLGGTLYEIAGWIKEGKNGKWTSLSIKPKDADAQQRKPAPKNTDDEQIPF